MRQVFSASPRVRQGQALLIQNTHVLMPSFCAPRSRRFWRKYIGMLPKDLGKWNFNLISLYCKNSLIHAYCLYNTHSHELFEDSLHAPESMKTSSQADSSICVYILSPIPFTYLLRSVLTACQAPFQALRDSGRRK